MAFFLFVFLIVSQPFSPNKAFHLSGRVRYTYTECPCPSLSKIFNHLHTPTPPPPSLTCFLLLWKENSMNAEAEAHEFFFSPRCLPKMSFAIGMQRGIKQNLNRIREDKQLSDGLTDWVVKYFTKEATCSIEFKGLSKQGLAWWSPVANFCFW